MALTRKELAEQSKTFAEQLSLQRQEFLSSRKPVFYFTVRPHSIGRRNLRMGNQGAPIQDVKVSLDPKHNGFQVQQHLRTAEGEWDLTFFPLGPTTHGTVLEDLNVHVSYIDQAGTKHVDTYNLCDNGSRMIRLTEPIASGQPKTD